MARISPILPVERPPGGLEVIVTAEEIPSPTTMAVLATSLVGLFLAGVQKRRK